MRRFWQRAASTQTCTTASSQSDKHRSDIKSKTVTGQTQNQTFRIAYRKLCGRSFYMALIALDAGHGGARLRKINYHIEKYYSIGYN